MSIISVIKKFNILLDRRQKNRVWILFGITLVGAFFEVLGVSLMVPLVSAIVQPDIITSNAFVSKVCDIFGITDHITFVIVCIVALICIYVVKNLFLMFEYYVQARFVFNNKFLTQRRMLHSFINKPYEFFLNASSGEILRMINSDVDQTFGLLMTFLQFVTETIVSVVLIITIFIIDPTMTCVIAALLVIVILLISKIVKPILRNKGQEFRDNNSQMYKWLIQSVQGIKEVKIAHKEKYFEDNYEESGRKAVSASKWESVFNNAPRTLIEMGCVCSTLAVIAVMIYCGRPIETLIPALGAFAMAAVKLMPSANRIVNMVNAISYQGPAIDNLIENLGKVEDMDVEEIQSNHSLKIENSIELKSIKYRYPNSESTVLEDASLEIPIGTSVGIVGRSGSGKTTTIDVMLGLLMPESGTVMVDGVDVMTDYADWLSHIGYIPQSMFMLDDSIKANVAFGCEPDDERVWQALKDAQLEEFVKSLPDGIDTMIGERGMRISGGQKQRIGIARALYNDPEILVFDEATSSLDNETEKAIMESVESLHGKKTMIIIAHRLQTIENCDIVYRVKDGKAERER